MRTAQHIDIVPLSFLSCEYVYILLKLCVSIAQCIEVGDRLMSSPVTSIVIICAHWPNKNILNGSCQCDGHNKQNKRQTTQRKGKTMTTTLSMAMRIPNIKYHYRVLALFGGYFFFPSFVQTNFSVMDSVGIVSNIFSGCRSFHLAIYSKSHTIYSIYFWLLTQFMCTKVPLVNF